MDLTIRNAPSDLRCGGRTFVVHIVLRGERYGLNDCLTHDHADPLVEIYDATSGPSGTYGPRGQFVSRYYASTLLNIRNDPWGRTRGERGMGLDLWGDAAEWKLDGAAMCRVLDYVEGVWAMHGFDDVDAALGRSVAS